MPFIMALVKSSGTIPMSSILRIYVFIYKILRIYVNLGLFDSLPVDISLLCIDRGQRDRLDGNLLIFMLSNGMFLNI